MKSITGIHPALPPRLDRLLTDPEHMTRLPNDIAAIEAFVTARSSVLTAAPVGGR